jgi:hypothetical protein
MKTTPEIIAKLKSEHAGSELRKVTLKNGDEIVVRSPSRPEWQRMQDESVDEKKRAAAMRSIVRSCVVFPSKEEFLAALDRKPGLIETLLPIVHELGGVEDAAQGEAL